MDPVSEYMDDSSAPVLEVDDAECSTDEDASIARTRAVLLACLDDVQTEGSFSAFHHVNTYPNPGLHIHDHGSVGLPLTEKDAKAITSICHQAPFGLKDQTVVDTTVRRTWELDNSRFECQNPNWLSYVSILARQATAALGVSVPARAEIYKMLLYEEGAFFKAHKDTEKVPGMFGTMVVCLPSRHEGGEVWLSHAGNTTVLDTSIDSQFDLTMLAWYSDVTHEVKPLTSGYRLVLTYNLVQDDPFQTQAAGLLTKNRERLATSLAECHNTSIDQSCFIYLLDHQYTEASLRLENLKGRDAAIGQYLNNVCTPNGFYFLFANMTGSFRDDDDDDYYHYDDQITLHHVVSPNGQRISGYIKIDKDNILDEDAFSGDCDSMDGAEFTGNASRPAEYRYHSTVVMLVPKSKFAQLILQRSRTTGEGKAIVDFVANDSYAHPTGKTERELAEKVLRTLLEGVANDQSVQNSLSSRYKSSLYHGLSHGRNMDLELLLLSLGAMADTLQRGDILQNVFQQASITESWPEEWISFLASRMVIDAMRTKTSDSCVWDQWLSGTVSSVRGFRGLRDIDLTLNRLRKHISDTSLQESFQSWADEKLSHMCGSIRCFQNEDVDVILALAMDHPKMLQEKISLVIGSFGNRSNILDFLIQLSDQPLDPGVISCTYTTIVQNTECLCPRPTAVHQPYQPNYYHSRNPPAYAPSSLQWPEVDAARFLTVMANVWTMEQHDLILSMATAMDLGLPLDQDGGQNFWESNSAKMTRFITDFVLLLKCHNDKTLIHAGKGTVLSALRDHATWATSKEPKKPQNWTRTLDLYHSCTCSECQKLKIFLQDPGLVSTQFTMAHTKRKHVKKALHPDLYEFQTTYLGQGRNDTLIITKTNNEYEASLRNWQRKLDRCRSNLQSLRVDFVEQMLGPELYKQVILLEPSPSSDLISEVPVATKQPLLSSDTAGNQTATVPSQVAGVKRKAQVIDLCGDD